MHFKCLHMSTFISGLFYKREEVGKMEGSVVKCVGGTRQRGGRDHTPSSWPCACPASPLDCWQGCPTQLSRKMAFDYDHLHVAPRSVFKRLVDFVGRFVLFYFVRRCDVLFLERDFVLIYCCFAIPAKKFIVQRKQMHLRGISKA